MKISNYNFIVRLDETRIVVFNSVRNKYAIFNINDYQDLSKNTDEYIQNIKNAFKTRKLKEYGFIVEDFVNEEILAELKYLENNYNSSVFTATVIPTTKCNLKCKYCFIDRNGKTMSKSVENNTISYLSRIILNKANNLKKFAVKWFGGEPLLHSEIISRISDALIELCNEHQIEFHAMLYSNLTILNDKIIDIIVKSKITQINTTLDGYDLENDKRRISKNQKKYFFDVIKNIQVIKNFCNVNIQINIDNENKLGITQLVKFLNDNEIVNGKNVTIGFNLVNDNSNIKDKNILMNYSDSEALDIIDECYKILQDKAVHTLPESTVKCIAQTNNSVTIDPEGRLYKCYKESKTNVSFGTIYDDNFEYNNYAYPNYIYNPFKRNRQKCIECEIFPICFGGCYNTENEELICSMKYILERKIRRYFDTVNYNNEKN